MSKNEKIIIFEFLYHHECLKLPHHIFKKNYDVKLFLGEVVFKKFKKTTFKKNEVHVQKQFFYENLWNKTLNKIKNFNLYQFYNLIIIFFNLLLIQFEMFSNTLKFFIFIKKEKPTYIYINTIDNLFSWFLIFGLFFIEKNKLIYVIHSTNILKKNTSKHVIERILNNFQVFILKKLFKKAKVFILLGEYLKFNFEKKKCYKNDK